jgi:hypothetical protein
VAVRAYKIEASKFCRAFFFNGISKLILFCSSPRLVLKSISVSLFL